MTEFLPSTPGIDLDTVLRRLERALNGIEGLAQLVRDREFARRQGIDLAGTPQPSLEQAGIALMCLADSGRDCITALRTAHRHQLLY